MRFLILLLVFIALCHGQGCTSADKVKCLAAAAGCGATCVCDLPVCECCVICLSCVTATVADCCECLFPGWSGCTDAAVNQTVYEQSKFFENPVIPELVKLKPNEDVFSESVLEDLINDNDL